MSLEPRGEMDAKEDVLLAKLAFMSARKTEMSWQDFMEEQLEEHMEILKETEEFEEYYESEI